MPYKEYFEDKPRKMLYIAMKYCDSGDLANRIKKQKNVPFTEKQVLKFFVHICLGLKYMHDRKILYR